MRWLTIRIRKGDGSWVWSDRGGWGDSYSDSWFGCLWLALKG